MDDVKKVKRGKPKTRGNGSGTVYKEGKKFRWMLTLPNGKRPTGIQPTKKLAELALAQAITENSRGLLTTPDRVTFKEYAESWLSRQKQLRPASRDMYRHEIAYAVEHIGKAKMQELRPIDLRNMFFRLSEREMTGVAKGKKMALETSGKIYTRVRTIFREALSDGVIHKNPMDGIKRVKSQDAPEKREGVALDFDQAARFREVGTALYEAGLCRAFPAFITSLSLGLRRGEVLGLVWSNVDFTKNQIHIRQSYKKENGKAVLGTLKTDSSERSLPLPGSLKAVLLELKETQKKEKAEARDVWIDTGAVFCTELGNLTQPSSYARSLDKFIQWSDPEYIQKDQARKSGSQIPRHAQAKVRAVVLAGEKLPELATHDLRHTYATLAIRSKTPIDVVSKLLGHASITITMDRYRHVSASEIQQEAPDLFSNPIPTRNVAIIPLN
jgi:integrase